MSERLHLEALDSRFPTFPCLQDTCHPKMYVFLSLQKFLLFFVCLQTPVVYKVYGFLPSGPTPFLCSHLAVCLLEQPEVPPWAPGHLGAGALRLLTLLASRLRPTNWSGMRWAPVLSVLSPGLALDSKAGANYTCPGRSLL